MATEIAEFETRWLDIGIKLNSKWTVQHEARIFFRVAPSLFLYWRTNYTIHWCCIRFMFTRTKIFSSGHPHPLSATNSSCMSALKTFSSEYVWKEWMQKKLIFVPREFRLKEYRIPPPLIFMTDTVYVIWLSSFVSTFLSTIFFFFCLVRIIRQRHVEHQNCKNHKDEQFRFVRLIEAFISYFVANKKYWTFLEYFYWIAAVDQWKVKQKKWAYCTVCRITKVLFSRFFISRNLLILHFKSKILYNQNSFAIRCIKPHSKLHKFVIEVVYDDK